MKRKTDTSYVHPSPHALFNTPSTANIHQAEILQEKKKPQLCLEDKEPQKSDDICPEAECSPSSVQRNIRIKEEDFGPSSILKYRTERLESPPELPSQGVRRSPSFPTHSRFPLAKP